MRKILFAGAAVLMATAGMGQSFYLGVNGSFKSTWMFNKNISDEGGEQDYHPGFAYDAGVVIGYMFSESVGIESGAFHSTFTQNYTGTIATVNYEASNSLTQLDIPLLVKFKSESGAYVSIGGLYSMISEAKHENDYPIIGDLNSGTVTNKYNSANVHGVLGLGGDLPMGDAWHFNLEMRFAYGFADIKGVDALGFDLNDKLLYPDYEKTWTAYGALMLGFRYVIGGYNSTF